MFGIDDLSLAMLGLSAGGDLFGAFNAYQRAKQAEQIRNLLTPGGIAAGTRGVYQPLTDEARKVTGRDIAASAATTGVPGAGGGAWDQYIADAFARLESSRMDSARDAYIRGVGGMGGLMQPQAGSTGASGDALKYLMLIQALNRGQNPTERSQGQVSSTYPGFSTDLRTNPLYANAPVSNMRDWNFIMNTPGGYQLDPTLSYGAQ